MTENTLKINNNLPKGMSITGMVLGIYSWTIGLCLCGGLTALVGSIISIIALVKCNRGEWGGRGMAVAGLILCGLFIGLQIIILII